MAPVDLSKRCFCVISGGSKGIGRGIALEMARVMGNRSKMLIFSRSENQMKEVRLEIKQINDTIEVQTVTLDLHRPKVDEIEGYFNMTKDYGGFETAVVVHNIGTIGDIEKFTATSEDVTEWENYFYTNLFSVITLNNVFLDACKAIPVKVVVNITSLCAIEAMKSLVLYCTGKAAREMYFKVLAIERPELLILNYSPGMVETDMAVDLRTKSADEELKKYAQNAFETKQLLSPQQTALKMLNVLSEGKFKSGDHVDYHDK